MGEIRIVGPGKIHGYPYPVCKKLRADFTIKVNGIPPFFICPFEKRSYYVIPLGVRPSVRPSVRL